MKRLMFLVAAVLACHSMQAQYFCTTEGTELHYVNYDEIGQSTSDETMTVSKVEKVDGKLQAAYYDKIVTTKAKNNTSYTLFNFVQLELRWSQYGMYGRFDVRSVCRF